MNLMILLATAVIAMPGTTPSAPAPAVITQSQLAQTKFMLSPSQYDALAKVAIPDPPVATAPVASIPMPGTTGAPVQTPGTGAGGSSQSAPAPTQGRTLIDLLFGGSQ